MEQELMTLKDIAQMLDLPESTLRKYRDAYPQFMPYVGSGRERRYREDAVEVFRTIRDCRVERHLSWDDTERELLGRFPVNADAAGGKAVVSESEANVFLEKLDKAVRQLTSQGERQEFVVSTLVTELLSMKKQVEKLAPILTPIQEDLTSVRKSTYSYNEVVQRQQKENQKRLMDIMEALASMQGALHYIPDEITRAVEAVPKPAPYVPKPEPVSPAQVAVLPEPKAGGMEAQVIARLRADLKDKENEVEKFKDLYVRAKREIDRLREELKKKTIEEMYGQRKPEAFEAPAASTASLKEEPLTGQGRKILFRGKKKKPGEF